MPTYNRAEYIVEAIESILNQTLQDFELIIIDDASVDTTIDLLQPFIHDSRIRFYRESQNQGQTVLRNKGVQFATGKYIAWADSDDICLPNRLEEQVSFLDANPTIGICGTAIEFIGSKTGKMYLPEGDELIRTSLLFNSAFANPTTMMRRNLFTQGLSYNEKYLFAEDYDLWVRAAPLTHFANLSKVLIFYRVHSQQESSQIIETQLLYLQPIWETQLNSLGIKPTEDEWQTHKTIAMLTPELLGATDLIKTHQWLLTLWYANQIHKQYSQSALTRIMTERWIALCKRSGWVGAQIFTRFALSPISNIIELMHFVHRQITR